MSSNSKVNLVPISEVTYINSTTAAAVDEYLMQTPGFSIDQLMELAGLAVATSVHHFIETNPANMSSSECQNINDKILILCGPGNNGGDGLVAARHLKQFGYEPTVCYPRQGKGQLFQNLVKQCLDLEIPIHTELSSLSLDGGPRHFSSFGFGYVVDALFGFSFSGPPREPYLTLIELMKGISPSVPVISVDIPSGYDVDQGDVYSTGFTPNAVISLTAPKKCMEGYRGRHFLGGRFTTPALNLHFKMKVPFYGKGSSQIVELVEPETNFSASVVPSSSSSQIYSDADDSIAVFVTASSSEEAKSIARGLLDRKLIACANLVPGVTSLYVWEGSMEESSEVIMMLKTRRSLLSEVTEAVKGLHSYTVPETIGVNVFGGNRAYLDWISSSTKDAKES